MVSSTSSHQAASSCNSSSRGPRWMRPGAWPWRRPTSASSAATCWSPTRGTVWSTPSTPAPGPPLGAFPAVPGAPIAKEGLHGLLFGVGDPLDSPAGPNAGADGLFGSLAPTPVSVQVEPATLAATVVNVAAFAGQPF